MSICLLGNIGWPYLPHMIFIKNIHNMVTIQWIHVNI